MYIGRMWRYVNLYRNKFENSKKKCVFNTSMKANRGTEKGKDIRDHMEIILHDVHLTCVELIHYSKTHSSIKYG